MLLLILPFVVIASNPFKKQQLFLLFVPPQNMTNTTLFDIALYNGKYRDFLDTILSVESPTLVFTPNPEIFVRASRDSEFMDILKQATYNVPDGNGLYVGYMMQEGVGFLQAGFRTLLAKKSLRKKYGELIKGSDLTRDFLESGKITPKSILVIDRKNAVPRNDLERKKAEVQKDLKHILESKYPQIQVHVLFAGEMAADGIAHYIELHDIGYVFSCIGMKAQEKALVEIFSYLPKTQKVVGLGVGASIDFLL